MAEAAPFRFRSTWAILYIYIYIDRALLFVFQSVMVVSSVCQVVGSFSCVLHGLVRFLEGLKTRSMRALKVLRV